MKKKVIIILIAIAVVICVYASKIIKLDNTNDAKTKEYNGNSETFSESFDRIIVDNDSSSNSSSTDTDSYNESEADQDDIVSSDHEAYSDVIEQSITTDEYFEYFDINQDWFNCPEDTATYYYSSAASVACAIYSYYNGEVPCEYYFDYDNDIVEVYTNLIYAVRAESQDSNYPDLRITIDAYANKLDAEIFE
jgi:hypothetical protein